MLRPRQLREAELIYDWNSVGRPARFEGDIEVLDETLRDGLQNPSIIHPTLENKVELLHCMNAVGIDVAKIGLPGSSQRAFDDCLALCQCVAKDGLNIRPACAGRTLHDDIEPIVEISQRTGQKVEIYAFVGSSPIRQLAEDWDIAFIQRRSAQAIDFGVRAGLPVTFVTEDTTRSRPEMLAELFKVAVDHGASRLCLCDTVGYATPDGVRTLIEFSRSVVAAMGAEVGIDWHGHNDRGMALQNALCALECGADRVHATALGIGERVGNAPMELILLNLKLAGALGGRDLSRLIDYCETAARALGWPVPINYPLVGRDAFRTATGVHAAAIIKAEAKGHSWLADRVYSGVPAGLFGRSQEICIGAMSGSSNVAYWLRRRGIEPTEALISAILGRAKESDRILTDDEILQIVGTVAGGVSDRPPK